ncbi:MAG TPA: hypothetical protein DCP31_12215 [Cyanobacteria bacterium UBA8543]|nr:hypothetical protein [Cyanobacteria bacterium UBA8543]
MVVGLGSRESGVERLSFFVVYSRSWGLLPNYLAIENRSYKNEVRQRGLLLKPAQAGFVCIASDFSLEAYIDVSKS